MDSPAGSTSSSGIKIRDNGQDSGSLGHPWDVLCVLVSKDLKVRYHNTSLGYVWSVLHPLVYVAMFYTVFRVVMRIDVPDYAMFLVSGLFVWQWISNSITQSATCFLNNRSLLRKVRFPRWLLVGSAVLNDLIHFSLTLPIIIGVVVAHGIWPTLHWVYQLPLMLAVTFLMTMGLALLLSTGNLFLRDLERASLLLMTIWFYLTPVIYPASMIPESARWLVYFNPLATVVVSWRGMFLDGSAPPWFLFASIGWASLIGGLGWVVYSRYQWRFAELV